MDYLKPNYQFDKIENIQEKFLKNNEIQGLIIDIDNTIIDKDLNISESKRKWLLNIAKTIKIIFLTNSCNAMKKELIEEKLGFKLIMNAKKPFKKGFDKALNYLDLKKENIAVIGDQLFSDILGGNVSKIKTILVKPITSDESNLVKIKRPFEKIILNYQKKSNFIYKKIMKKVITIIFLIMICLMTLLPNMIKLNKNHVYEIPKTYRYDRFYSFDELHYSTSIYTSDINGKYIDKSVAIKHPFLSYFGNIYTISLEKTFHLDNHQSKYIAIICTQILLTIISVIFLYLIFYDIFKINNFTSIILSLLYIFANSIIISTLLIESFIISGTLLIMSFYFISKKKYIITGILGSIVFGTTITNIVLWGLMILAITGIKNYRDILKITISFILTTVFLIGIVYIFEKQFLNFVYTNFLETIKNNSETFKFDTNFYGIIKYSYYFILGAPFLYLNTVDTTQIGTNKGYAISFIPKATPYITIVIFIIVSLLIYSLIIGIKNKNKYSISCLLMFIFNVILHCGFKFGLHEAFIYAPHYLFSYLIMFSISVKYSKKAKPYIIIFITILLILSLLINFNSINDIIWVTHQGLRG